MVRVVWVMGLLLKAAWVGAIRHCLLCRATARGRCYTMGVRRFLIGPAAVICETGGNWVPVGLRCEVRAMGRVIASFLLGLFVGSGVLFLACRGFLLIA